MQSTISALLAAMALSSPVLAQALDPLPDSSLGALSDSVQALVRRVHPCVVKIVAMGFSGESDVGVKTGIVNRRQSTGSGVIVDPDGLIVTNAHVLWPVPSGYR